MTFYFAVATMVSAILWWIASARNSSWTHGLSITFWVIAGVWVLYEIFRHAAARAFAAAAARNAGHAIASGARHTRVWIRRDVVPFVGGVLGGIRPWAERNWCLILAIITGGVAWWLYQGNRDWDNQSNWFYLFAAASFTFLLGWSTFTRRLLAGAVVWVLERFADGWRITWGHFQGANWFGKGITYAVAALGLSITSSLVQELFHRGSGWFFQWLHISTFGFGRITWNGVFLIAGTFLVATVILMWLTPHIWPNARRRAQAAQPAPASANAAAQQAAIDVAVARAMRRWVRRQRGI